MPRRPFTTWSTLSLVLCAATCVLWVRSYLVQDRGSWAGRDRSLLVEGREGGLRWVVVRRDSQAAAAWAGRDAADDAYRDLPHPVLLADPGFRYERARPRPLVLLWDSTRPRYGKFGFAHGYVPSPGGGSLASEWMAPYYPLAFLLGVAPARSLRRSLARSVGRRRSARGACPACGYDLRATPARCPECGTVAGIANISN